VEQMCRAGVLEDVGVAKLRFNAGHLAVLLYQHVDHTALDPAAPVGREERPKPRPADLQPGVEDAALFAAQMVLTAVRSFQPVDEDALRPRVVVTELEESNLAGSQAGVVQQPEQRAIARGIDHAEEAVNLLGLQVARLLFEAALSLCLRGFKGAGGGGFVIHVRSRYWR